MVLSTLIHPSENKHNNDFNGLFVYTLFNYLTKLNQLLIFHESDEPQFEHRVFQFPHIFLRQKKLAIQFVHVYNSNLSILNLIQIHELIQ